MFVCQVDIRIEEGWDKEAFEHRGWKNWDWLREHYDGERHGQTAGNNQIQLGFEPTLSHMMAEMLRAGDTTPDEILAALKTLARKNKPLHEAQDVEEDGEGAGDDSQTRIETEDPSRIGIPSSGSEHQSIRQGSENLKEPQRKLTTWHRGRAPWAVTGETPWARHVRLMSEISKPEDPEDAGLPPGGRGRRGSSRGREREQRRSSRRKNAAGGRGWVAGRFRSPAVVRRGKAGHRRRGPSRAASL